MKDGLTLSEQLTLGLALRISSPDGKDVILLCESEVRRRRLFPPSFTPPHRTTFPSRLRTRNSTGSKRSKRCARSARPPPSASWNGTSPS